jgi:LysM repeat protein
MKPSLLFTLLCTLTCSSCQNFKLPWQKAAVNPDPYAAAGAAGGQYQAYPGSGQAGANPNYAYPNYTPTGEQAQVTPANGAPAQNWNTPQEDWSNGGTTAAATKKTTSKTTGKPAVKSTSTTATASKGGSYTVKRGDTLSSISRTNGTTVAKLMQANGLKSTTIREGQTLRLR